MDRRMNHITSIMIYKALQFYIYVLHIHDIIYEGAFLIIP